MKQIKKPVARKTVGEAVADVLEMPKDILLNTPKLMVFNNKEMTIENYRGVLEYSDTVVRLNTAVYILVVTGEELTISSIASEMVTIYGKISKIEFT